MEILIANYRKIQKNHDGSIYKALSVFTPSDIYYVAYQHLYSNKGAGTKGVTDDTADGFSPKIYIKISLMP